MILQRRTLQYVPLSAIASVIAEHAGLEFDSDMLFRLISSEFDNPDNNDGVVTCVRAVLDALCNLPADGLGYDLDLTDDECEHLSCTFHVVNEVFPDDYTACIVCESGE